ncbi:MAG: hypothetical protein N4A46_06640 [Schleiferiaceae bacterium]|nr:hypothetical protein [Schleiferiaceae bacterium]
MSSTQTKNTQNFTISRIMNVSAQELWKHLVYKYGDIADMNPVVHRSYLLDWHTEGVENCERISYYEGDESKFIKEKLINLDNENLSYTSVITEAHNISADPGNMFVNITIQPMFNNQSRLEFEVHSKTLPSFVGVVKREFFEESLQSYFIGIEHHIQTGEIITPRVIRKLKAQAA